MTTSSVDQPIYIHSPNRQAITSKIGVIPFDNFPIEVKVSYFVSAIDGASEATGSGLAGISIISNGIYYIVSFSVAIALLKLF